MSQVSLLLSKACKSYGALFRRQCYMYATRKKSMRKSGKSYKCFDMLGVTILHARDIQNINKSGQIKP